MEKESRKTFKFVASGGFSGQKRQQSTRACEDCRRRKKRCQHNAAEEQPQRAQTTFSPTSPSTVSQATYAGERSSGNQQTQRAGQEDHVAVGRNERHKLSLDGGQSRYVGDLSPEAIFAAATRYAKSIPGLTSWAYPYPQWTKSIALTQFFTSIRHIESYRDFQTLVVQSRTL